MARGRRLDDAGTPLSRRRMRRESMAHHMFLGEGLCCRSSSRRFPQDLLGHIFLVGNVILGFSRHLGRRHPCCVLQDRGRMVDVSKGTDLTNILPHMRELYVVVYPDGSNGLTKPTAFEPFKRDLPRRALFQEDCLGSLSEADLQRIVEAVRRHGQ